MNHHDSLNVKYVIWGQRIWEASKSAPKHWSQWTPMEDRDSITQNHWYVADIPINFSDHNS